MNMAPIVVHRKSGKAAARLVAEAREDSRQAVTPRPPAITAGGGREAEVRRRSASLGQGDVGDRIFQTEDRERRKSNLARVTPPARQTLRRWVIAGVFGRSRHPM